MLRITLFGATSVTDGNRTLSTRDLGGVKPRQILEILALEPGHPVSKDRLAELLWEGAPPASYVATLESYVSVLRRKIGPSAGRGSSALVTAHGGYLLDPSKASVDVADFRRLLSESASAAGRQQLALCRQAIDLAKGQLLESEPYALWALQARESVLADVVALATRASAAALSLSDVDAAESMARRAIEIEPLAEAAWQHLIRAQWLGGRRAEALRSYDELRTVLDREMGVDPVRETRDLHLAILRDDAPADVREEPMRQPIEAVSHLLLEALVQLRGAEISIPETTLTQVATRLIERVGAIRPLAGAGLVGAGMAA